MSDQISPCPKCGGQFEVGYLPDASYGAQVVGRWASGAPAKSFWTVTKVSKQTVPLGAYRCTGCGYVELYARDEFAPQ
jgi:predicted nucleic-acid-binding Zn-ribbon protein